MFARIADKDARTLAAAVAVLRAVSFPAVFLPVRKAAVIDPLVAIRAG